MTIRSLFPLAAGLTLAIGLSDVARAAGETASAQLKFADGSDAGTIKLTAATAGILVKIELKGLKPGPHGLHIHDSGKCDGDFSSAGGIYNPFGAKHGFLNEEGPMAGDLPNVIAASDGTAVAEILSPVLKLDKDAEDSLLDADGAAIVIDEKADDYQTDPDGGTGARIACGILKTP